MCRGHAHFGRASLVAQTVKSFICSVGDLGSIPESGRSPGEGNGTPLQCPCLAESMDRGAWRATVPGVAKGQTHLSDVTFTFPLSCSLTRFPYMEGSGWGDSHPELSNQRHFHGCPTSAGRSRVWGP